MTAESLFEILVGHRDASDLRSASSAARRCWVAACRRDFTVPSGTSRSRAIWGTVRSRPNRSARSACSSAVSRWIAARRSSPGGAVSGAASVVAGRIERNEADARRTPPQLVAADVDEDPGEPAVGRRRVPQGTTTPPRQEGRLLDGVLGRDAVVEDERRQAERVVDPRREHLSNGVVRSGGSHGLIQH